MFPAYQDGYALESDAHAPLDVEVGRRRDAHDHDGKRENKAERRRGEREKEPDKELPRVRESGRRRPRGWRRIIVRIRTPRLFVRVQRPCALGRAVGIAKEQRRPLCGLIEESRAGICSLHAGLVAREVCARLVMVTVCSDGVRLRMAARASLGLISLRLITALANVLQLLVGSTSCASPH